MTMNKTLLRLFFLSRYFSNCVLMISAWSKYKESRARVCNSRKKNDFPIRLLSILRDESCIRRFAERLLADVGAFLYVLGPVVETLAILYHGILFDAAANRYSPFLSLSLSWTFDFSKYAYITELTQCPSGFYSDTTKRKKNQWRQSLNRFNSWKANAPCILTFFVSF